MSENAYIKKESERGTDNSHTCGFTDLLELYRLELETRKYAARTIRSYLRPIEKSFLPFISEKGVGRIQDVTATHLEQYRQCLVGRGFTGWSVLHYVRAAKRFFEYLEKTGTLFSDPAAGISMTTPDPASLYVPTPGEVAKLLGSIHSSSPAGIRDTAMIGIICDAALKRRELLSLDTLSLDLENKALKIQGRKRGKRAVPLENGTVEQILCYLEDARPILLADNIDENALWINVWSKPVTNEGFQQIMRRLSHRAGLDRLISSQALHRYVKQREKNENEQ